jgi:hypothetical protein
MTFCAKALVKTMHPSAAEMHGQINRTRRRGFWYGNLFTAIAGWSTNLNFHPHSKIHRKAARRVVGLGLNYVSFLM